LIVSGTRLANNLEIEIADQSRNYFGDYHRIKLVISITVPLLSVAGLSPIEIEDATRVFGSTVSYHKTLEKMGVGSDDVPRVKQEMLANFSENSVPYLQSHRFPVQFVRSSLARSKRGKL
jgi:hypothetical protein